MKSTLTILLFSPHSAIWIHAFPEALIAEALQQENHRIVYVGCGEEFQSFCVCMSAYGLKQSSSEQEKKAICKICNKQKEIIKNNFKFDGYDISKLVTETERARTELILQKTTFQNFLELKIDGIELGRIALYELLLQYKKSNLNFSKNEWSSYLISLKNTLISFFASRRILDKEKPDRVLTYNSLYSVNQVCCQLAESRGIPTYFLHAGSNLSNRLETMMLGTKSTYAFNENLKDYWNTYKQIPCSHDSLKLVTDHFLHLFEGKHFLAYSSAKIDKIDIRDLFKVKENQKILVAAMSSNDESFAAEAINAIPQYDNLIFPQQIDWIQFVIEFVRYRPDLFLIIRVHPREFPNKRDSVRSEYAQILEKVFKNLPDNVKLNLPEDHLSIYDLAEYTDLFLNCLSSVGEEMSLLGIPVLIYSSDLVAYPSEINYVATSQEDFCQKIDVALADGWSFERVRTTYRWYVLKLVRSIFDISDSVRWYETNSSAKKPTYQQILVNFIYRIYYKILFTILRNNTRVNYNERIQDCKKRATSLKAQKVISKLIQDKKNIVLDIINQEEEPSIDLSTETEALKHEISRLSNRFFRRI
ncbi:MAG: capsule biosynthesis protein [Microcystis sp. M046S1]|uniref:hypothetical protein n=1 Tax=Microcystis sp. M046S1 TaxID=2771118 RepID=UPI00258674DD|nr:hypothetical protein [Microcystis sp. M046S1]MCA2882098.1 capsule biosynthesis protein [Microcystis sp. M046S1]